MRSGSVQVATLCHCGSEKTKQGTRSEGNFAESLHSTCVDTSPSSGASIRATGGRARLAWAFLGFLRLLPRSVTGGRHNHPRARSPPSSQSKSGRSIDPRGRGDRTLDTRTSLTIRHVRLDELHQDPANARQHGERNMEAIRGSLTRFGQAEPLVVQKRSGRVIGGNGRLEAMRALGWNECDVVEVELDDVQATALGIALNRAGDLADWNLPALGSLLESL